MDTVKLLPIEGCDCTEPWQFYGAGRVLRSIRQFGTVLCDSSSCIEFHPADTDSPGSPLSPCNGARCGAIGCPECEVVPPESPKGKQDFSGEIDGAGYKGSMDNPSKPPLSLLSRSALWAIAAVMGKGALKYARGNWMRGMSFSEVADAAMRHLTAWIDGEDNDPETGLSHLAHVGCCIMFLLHYTHGRRKEEYVRFDDRIYSR